MLENFSQNKNIYLQSWTKYFGPGVISYVAVLFTSPFLPPPSLQYINVVLFENCSPFTSIFNIDMGEGGVISTEIMKCKEITCWVQIFCQISWTKYFEPEVISYVSVLL